MKVIVAWFVGLVMGVGGLLAWGVFDKRIELTFYSGPTAPDGLRQQAKTPNLAPLRDEVARTPTVDISTLSVSAEVGAPLPLAPGETVQSKFGAPSVGESVAPGGSSTERGKLQ